MRMASVLNRSTLEYRSSVNTPDFPESEWIINPDISVVDGWSRKYWKIEGDSVLLMTDSERAAVDSSDLESAKDARVATAEQGLGPLLDVFVAMTNQTRVQSGLVEITKQDVLDTARSIS